MKNYRVTVNGTAYEVSVEELGSDGASSTPSPAPSSANKAPQKAAAPAPSSGSVGGHKVLSPMPGTVLDIKVSQGEKVSANKVVIILEAMKMENEIVTPVSGTVASINVTKGASVNTGDLLVSIAQ